MFSLLQEKSTIDSKISSLIFFFLLDVLLSKWFNVVSKLTANIRFYAPVTHEFGIQFALTNKRQQMGRTYLFPKM